MVFGGGETRVYSLSRALPCSWMHPPGTLSGEDQKWGLSRYKEFLIQLFLFLSLFSSIPFQFSCSVVSDSLGRHGLQHSRLPCPLPTPGGYSNSCPLSRWCHPTISFSFCLQSFPASGSFQMSQLFASGGQSIGVSASTSVLPMNIQDWFPLGWTGWISLQTKGLSRVFSNTTVQKHQFSGTPTLTSIHDYWKNYSVD